jgi:hypothetical protein
MKYHAAAAFHAMQRMTFDSHFVLPRAMFDVRIIHQNKQTAGTSPMRLIFIQAAYIFTPYIS